MATEAPHGTSIIEVIHLITLEVVVAIHQSIRVPEKIVFL